MSADRKSFRLHIAWRSHRSVPWDGKISDESAGEREFSALGPLMPKGLQTASAVDALRHPRLIDLPAVVLPAGCRYAAQPTGRQWVTGSSPQDRAIAIFCAALRGPSSPGQIRAWTAFFPSRGQRVTKDIGRVQAATSLGMGGERNIGVPTHNRPESACSTATIRGVHQVWVIRLRAAQPGLPFRASAKNVVVPVRGMGRSSACACRYR